MIMELFSLQDYDCYILLCPLFNKLKYFSVNIFSGMVEVNQMPSWNPSETVGKFVCFQPRFEFIKSGMTSTDQKLKSQLIFSFIDQECFIVVVISI